MKKSFRKCLIAVLAVTFVVSGGMVLKTLSAYKAGEQTYRSVQALAGLQDDLQGDIQGAMQNDIQGALQKDTQGASQVDLQSDLQQEENDSNPLPNVSEGSLKNLNFQELQQINKDVMGWIIIPGAGISYPLMDGSDNSYYLNHTWDKQRNAMGSIFLEKECCSSLKEFNTIIYGHNMRNSTMFSNLKKYVKKAFWQQAPYVYIATENSVRKYHIFAAYEVSTEGHAFWIDIEDDGNKQKFIDKSIKMSEISTGIVPEISDHILTLATCTGNGHEKRMIVQAVLASEEE